MKKVIAILVLLSVNSGVYAQCDPLWPTVSGANQIITVNSRVPSGASLTGTLVVNSGVTLCTEGTASITVSYLTNNGTIIHNGTGAFTANREVINNGVINSTSVGFSKTNSGYPITNNANASFTCAGSMSIAASTFTNGLNANLTITGNLTVNCHADNYGNITISGNLSKTNSGSSFVVHSGNISISGTASLLTDSLIVDSGSSIISNGNMTYRGVVWNHGTIETTNGTMYKQFSSSFPIYNFSTGQIKSFSDMTLEGEIINDGRIEITNSGIFDKTNSGKPITNNVSGQIIIRGSTSNFIARGNLTNSGRIICEGDMDRSLSTSSTLLNNSTGYIRVCGKYSKKANLTNNGIIEVGNDLFFTGSSSNIIQNNSTGQIHIVNNLDFFCNLRNYGHIIIGDSLWHRNNSSGLITIADSGSINVVNYIHNNGALIGGATPSQIGFLRICGVSQTLNTVSLSGYLDICDNSSMLVAPYFDIESPTYAYPMATVSDCGSLPKDTTSTFLDSCSNSRINSGACTFIVLPIELINFDVIQENKFAKIYWATASEINNDYFTIERSIDGLLFEQIGVVKGAGNSSSILNYTFYDEKPFRGISYYRLKQVNFDGKYEYSDIRVVNFEQKATEVIIYPNPTNNQITIQADNQELTNIKIYNTLGQDVTNQIKLVNKSDNKITINLTNLSIGLYTIKTTTTANKVYKK